MLCVYSLCVTYVSHIATNICRGYHYNIFVVVKVLIKYFDLSFGMFMSIFDKTSELQSYVPIRFSLVFVPMLLILVWCFRIPLYMRWILKINIHYTISRLNDICILFQIFQVYEWSQNKSHSKISYGYVLKV